MAKPDIDPEARSKLLAAVEEALYAKTRQRMLNTRMTLIRENSTACGNNQNGMSFKGKIYTYGKLKKLEGPLNLTHKAMRDKVKAYIQSENDLQREQDIVLGYIRRVMLQSRYAEDLAKLLPDALHRTLSKLDRFFLLGDGTLTAEAAQLFLENNHKYSRMVKARLAYNLLDVAPI